MASQIELQESPKKESSILWGEAKIFKEILEFLSLSKTFKRVR